MMAIRLGCIKIFRNSQKCLRLMSSSPCNLNYKLVDKIVLTQDGTTLVAWHPKKDFPYECTRPLPDLKDEDNGSLLRNINTQHVFKNQSPEAVRQELSKITHTTKHRWFPRARDKRAKKTVMDREYL